MGEVTERNGMMSAPGECELVRARRAMDSGKEMGRVGKWDDACDSGIPVNTHYHDPPLRSDTAPIAPAYPYACTQDNCFTWNIGCMHARVIRDDYTCVLGENNIACDTVG